LSQNIESGVSPARQQNPASRPGFVCRHGLVASFVAFPPQAPE
jgi:hypothetical protein